MTDLEFRPTPGRVDVRAAAAGKRTIGGYAAKFNKQSRNLGGFVERIAPSAFNKSRGDGWPEVLARYNHNDDMVLGSTAGRTLRLNVDEEGLTYEVDLPEARADVFELVQRGDVSRSSFAFIVPPNGDEWALNDMDIPLRTLSTVKLVDVAPVNTPAYLDTSTGLRSLAKAMEAPMEDVRRLAEANELRKFFKRTDGGRSEAAKHDLGASARMSLLARKSDPWA